MFNFSPTLRMLVDCRLIQQSIKQGLHLIKPCRQCKQYSYTPESGPKCLGLSILKRMVYDITRNIFVNPHCHHVFTKR